MGQLKSMLKNTDRKTKQSTLTNIYKNMSPIDLIMLEKLADKFNDVHLLAFYRCWFVVCR